MYQEQAPRESNLSYRSGDADQVNIGGDIEHHGDINVEFGDGRLTEI